MGGFSAGDHIVLTRSDLPPPQHLGTFTVPNTGIVTLTAEMVNGTFTYTVFSDPNLNSVLDPGEISTSIKATTINCSTPAGNPPNCTTAAPSITQLWPPNHMMRTITIGGITDPDGDQVSTSITKVFQDEPTQFQPGDLSPDAVIQNGNSVQLRAERLGNADGRVYHIEFTASDGTAAGVCNGEVTVSVPHDQSGRQAVDQGKLFDSTH